jgi:hypothetical protein
MPSADDLFAVRAPAIKWPELNTRHTMKITEVGELGVEKDDDGNPKLFPSGDTRPELICKVNVDERDPEIQDDDGDRTLWLAGMALKATIDAVRAAKAPGLRVGGVLDMIHHDASPPKSSKHKPTKLFRAKWTPPVPGADDLFGDPAPAKNSPPVDDDPPW